LAFTKTPVNSTYQTKTVSLLAELNSRGTVPTTDVDYLNCFPEVNKNKTTSEKSVHIRKRDGYSSFLTLVASTNRGIYFWEDQARLYVATGNDITVYSIPDGTVLATLTNIFPTTTTGEVSFTEFLYDDGGVKIVVTDGTTLSTIDTANVVVASADADMPVHLPCIVFLDGYLFMIKQGTADLYNSDLNDPLAFTVGNFISSEIIPDKAIWLAKLNNYLLLFGNNSIEYFWDAANESGTPLQRNDSPTKFIGYMGGIAQLGSKIYFVGDFNHSQANVFMLEDFKMTPVGNESLSRYLNTVTGNVKGNLISFSGFNFYVLYAGSYTYVLELESSLWHRWSIGDDTFFNMNSSFNSKIGLVNYSFFTLTDDNKLYRFLPSLYQDDGENITTRGVTNNEEFETRNKKFMSKLTVWADKPTGASPLLIQWSDDDYQTWNDGITIDLNQDHPSDGRLGSFRRRAFKWTHTANQPLRLGQFEVDLNMGNN
jgi:hypothetical protein